MYRFDFLGVGRIIFGRGQIARIADLAAGLGRTALVITNADRPGQGGVADRLAGLLGQAGVGMVWLWQAGEPQTTDVERGLEIGRRQRCDVLVGLGGGSAMDLAKAVAGILANGGGPLDYMEVVGAGRKLTRPAVPWIAVPTTAGTGAEVTRNAVIACPERRFKASIRSEHLLARAVVVDPELGVSVPPDISAAAGMDALCQLVESYTSSGAQPITDALALKGMALAAEALRRVCADGGDLDARQDMALAALLSGIALTNAGLGAVHGIAAPLGAGLAAPHGVICAALLPHVMRANVDALRAASPDHPSLARYAEIGRTLTGARHLPDPQAAEAGIRFVADLARELRIPPLGRFGLTADAVPPLVAEAQRASSMKYNPVRLSDEALAGVLRAAMD